MVIVAREQRSFLSNATPTPGASIRPTFLGGCGHISPPGEASGGEEVSMATTIAPGESSCRRAELVDVQPRWQLAGRLRPVQSQIRPYPLHSKFCIAL